MCLYKPKANFYKPPIPIFITNDPPVQKKPIQFPEWAACIEMNAKTLEYKLRTQKVGSILMHDFVDQLLVRGVHFEGYEGADREGADGIGNR